MFKYFFLFRINETGKDPGFGQSILHENQLVFHTPPYNSHDVSIHDTAAVWNEIKQNTVNVKVRLVLLKMILECLKFF